MYEQAPLPSCSLFSPCFSTFHQFFIACLGYIHGSLSVYSNSDAASPVQVSPFSSVVAVSPQFRLYTPPWLFLLNFKLEAVTMEWVITLCTSAHKTKRQLTPLSQIVLYQNCNFCNSSNHAVGSEPGWLWQGCHAPKSLMLASCDSRGSQLPECNTIQ